MQLLGSGSILREALRAQTILAEKYDISSTAWSVTSYKQLHRDAQARGAGTCCIPAKRRAQLPGKVLEGVQGPFIATSDYVRAVSEQIDPWVPGGLYAWAPTAWVAATRGRLRRHFEIDAECITLTALQQLARASASSIRNSSPNVIRDLGIDPDKIDPMIA